MGFELTTLMVIGTDYTGSCKSNYLHVLNTNQSINIKYMYLYFWLLSSALF